MATSATFVFFLYLLLRVSFSMPISLDVKTVKSKSDIAIVTEKTIVHVTETILGFEEETKLVKTLGTESVLNAFESVEVDKRIKREITKSKAFCPGDMILYGNKCLTPKQFAEYNDVSEGSDDYEEER